MTSQLRLHTNRRATGSRTKLRRELPLLALLVASAAVCAPAGVRAQALVQAPRPAPAAAYSYVFLDPLEQQKQEMKTAEADGSHLGIQMHGHWVIDVKNPDGSVAQHRDFENSIQQYGQEFLIGFMAGYYVPGNYSLYTYSYSGTTPCVLKSGNTTGYGCLIVTSTAVQPGLEYCTIYLCSTNLTQTYNLTSYPYTMVLAGSITANQAGTIDTVATYAAACSNNQANAISTTPTSASTGSPASCLTNTTTQLATVVLSSASITSVPVSANQIIQVTLTITFS